jgi:AmmeMemoRadiSam system protein B
MTTRRAAVAGTFYPADPRRLAAEVDAHRAAGRAAASHGVRPKAIVAPHAGYLYSGPIAGSAFAALAAGAAAIRRVVLLGPAHFVACRGLALPTVDAFATPLGEVPLDPDAGARLAALPQVERADRPHTPEHSLEVELPFLQRTLGDFALVPLVVGDAGDEEVAEVLDRLWGGEETAIVVSTDLSHYLDVDSARRRDAATARAVEALAPAAIADDDACGARPLRGLLLAARARSLAARTLDLRNSSDTASDPDRVVGYGAFAFG